MRNILIGVGLVGIWLSYEFAKDIVKLRDKNDTLTGRNRDAEAKTDIQRDILEDFVSDYNDMTNVKPADIAAWLNKVYGTEGGYFEVIHPGTPFGTVQASYDAATYFTRKI